MRVERDPKSFGMLKAVPNPALSKGSSSAFSTAPQHVVEAIQTADPKLTAGRDFIADVVSLQPGAMRLLWGPPGTGKTRTIYAAAAALVSLIRDKKVECKEDMLPVLVTAATNVAALSFARRAHLAQKCAVLMFSSDHWLSSAGDAGVPSCNFARIILTLGSEFPSSIFGNLLNLRHKMQDPEVSEDTLTAHAQAKAARTRMLLRFCDIAVCTSSNVVALKGCDVHTVLKDEAALETTPECLLAMDSAQRVGLIGDHLQFRARPSFLMPATPEKKETLPADFQWNTQETIRKLGRS
eukprot:g18574.t1